MSGLSMADMRRIGERRNTSTLGAEPARGGLLSKLTVNLPFAGQQGRADGDRATPSVANNHQAVDRLNRLQGAQPDQHLPSPPATCVTTDPFAKAPTQLSAMTAKQAGAPLRSDTRIKAGIGAGLGAAAGFAATGAVIALPAGLAVGSMAGLALAKRSQADAAGRGKTITVKRKRAETLFAAFEEVCVPLGINTPTLNLTINQSAALRIVSSGKPAKRKLDLTIGLPLLIGLSVQQLRSLFAQTLGCTLAAETSSHEHVGPSIIAKLDTLHAKKAKRAKEGSAKFEAFSRHVHSAQFAWSAAATDLDRQADNLTASVVGSAGLVDAMLAQGLIAEQFCKRDESLTFQDRIQTLRAGYSQSDLNTALQGLASAKEDACSHLAGMPLRLLDRISALDTSIPVPCVPAREPAFHVLDDQLQTKLNRQLAGTKASPKNTKAKKEKPAKKIKKPKAPRVSIFARFKKDRSAPDLPAITTSAEPLYDADAIFKSDAGVGLEAYQSLVDANPRWALARLRLAEAQIECGLGDGVANLMMAAEQLPSAMPTILSTLQGALPMVSPLEEEPLRQAIERMWVDADAVADERAQIDLARLEAPRMDEADLTTLHNLFANARGLREAWVFNLPCVHVPDVPHHAILGLAPRLPDEDAEILAMQLAEHAAILGTVAVHIETGTPRGGLGDALASQPSLWRADNS